jgi:arylsulfatase A-like enzyme
MGLRRATIAIFLLGALACAGRGEPLPKSAATPPNVILISIDTLRSDHLGCYGHDRDTSPNIDRMAAAGALFEHAFSPTAWTLPGHASMFSGLAPRRHGATIAKTAIREDVPLLAEILAAEGYGTAAVVNAPFMQAKFGFDRGFERFDYIPKLEVARHQQAVLETLRGERDRPFFHFLHYMSVHDPYSPEERFNKFVGEYEQPIGVDGQKLLKLWRAMDRGEASLNEDEVRYLNDLYAGGILSIDARMGELFDELDRLELTDSTIVILTSDHGEEFMEHGSIVHTKTLYDELLAVPLILRGPGIPAGARVQSMAGLVDILPTVLGLAGFELPAGLDGVDLAELWRDDTVPERMMEIETSWIDGTRAKRGIRTPTRKLIVNLDDGSREFYDLVQDPGENTNLYPHPAAEELESLLGSLQQEQAGEAVELNEQDVERLRALGYMQ